jgi:hypothetical protein
MHYQDNEHDAPNKYTYHSRWRGENGQLKALWHDVGSAFIILLLISKTEALY